MLGVAPLATVATRLMSVKPAPGVSITCAGWPATRWADRQGREILVELQRADRCSVTELQIIPGPARPDTLVVKTLVVTDYSAVDLLNAGR